MSQEDVESALEQIDWARLTEGREFFPSPAEWAEEVRYFRLVDRFSDGREFSGFRDVAGAEVAGPAAERTTPLFLLETDASNAEREAWFAAGRRWCGGTVAGLIDKPGYLRCLGVSAVWLNPVFRQVTGSNDYHGYGIQCSYYGTEQGSDGADRRSGDASDAFSDAFLRECLFGGPFGSLQSTGRHFFNEDHEPYLHGCADRPASPAYCPAARPSTCVRSRPTVRRVASNIRNPEAVSCAGWWPGRDCSATANTCAPSTLTRDVP